MRVQVTFDNVGCLSVIVLAVAIHWTLVSHFGASGLGSGFAVWSLAVVAGLVIGGRISARENARDELRAKQAFEAAACPWCGVPIGATGANAIREESARAMRATIREGMAQGLRVNPRRDWFGRCPACQKPIAFDAAKRTIGPDR